jgi:hypothetical protein
MYIKLFKNHTKPAYGREAAKENMRPYIPGLGSEPKEHKKILTFLN